MTWPNNKYISGGRAGIKGFFDFFPWKWQLFILLLFLFFFSSSLNLNRMKKMREGYKIATLFKKNKKEEKII
jgi:hypothetical protein